jgi:amino acid transporter
VLAAAVAFGQSYAFRYVVPISIGITALLVIVTTSYRQTIHAYPSGGGAYIVAKENLGTNPGLVAAAALLVDYVLTVSVSVSAGVAAITSAAQGTHYAWLGQRRVALCLVFIGLIAFINLRGVRESGALFAVPTYFFLVSFLCMIGYGFVHYYTTGATAGAPGPDDLRIAEGYAPQPLSVFLLLGAFSNGCAALTGIEAISNGVPAFKPPEARNAAITLTWMAALLATMFLGTSVLAFLYGVYPRVNETVISQFARAMFSGPMLWFYYVVQAATAAILVLAANTSFADFPRLSSLLARDRFLPRQLANRGDRLVFSNGVIILALFSSLLVIIFGGDTSRLIPLYAVGVFLSFTLSQVGMVKHWLAVRDRRREAGRGVLEQPATGEGAAAGRAPRGSAQASGDDGTPLSGNWRKSIAINALGATATAVVLIVFILTKFIHGAWIVVVVIPLLVLVFRAIQGHYMSVARQLSTDGLEPLRPVNHTVLVPISGVHRGVINALRYAKSISPGNVAAVYVDIDEEATARLREKWERWGQGIKLIVLPSPYRELTGPLLRYIYQLEPGRDEDMITVVIPEFVPAKWWQHLLHNQSSLLLKGALLFKEGINVVNVPYHLRH